MEDPERRIRQYAIEAFPDSLERSFAYYQMQLEAYYQFEAFCPRDIPSVTLRKIKRRAAAQDGDDYVGRMHTVEREVFAYRLLQGEEDADIPAADRAFIRKLAKIAVGSKADFRTQCFHYRRQIAAFRAIEKLRDSCASELAFDEALRLAQWNHPGDLVAQYEEVKQVIGQGNEVAVSSDDLSDGVGDNAIGSSPLTENAVAL